jgi:hypothetical protein
MHEGGCQRARPQAQRRAPEDLAKESSASDQL